MRLLLFCFLGIVVTTSGTILLEGSLQYGCQIGFVVFAVGSTLLWMSGQFN